MSKVGDTLTELAACLTVAIEESDGPGVCFVGVVPGDAAEQSYVGDCDDCGMAWVRMGSLYPAVDPGQQDERPKNCGSGLGFDVEVAIMRCAPMPSDDGEPPTPEALAEAVALQVKDALLMKKAIACCSSLKSSDYVLGSYQPIGPAGGLVGGVWSLSIAVV